MQDELQKKYIEYQLLQQQIQQIYQQLQQVEMQIVELDNVIHSLDEFKEAKQGSDMLVPIASGIFVYAALKDNKNLRVNVGSNVSVKKTVDETIELVKRQMDELVNYRDQVVLNHNRLSVKFSEVEKELRALVPEQKEENEAGEP